MTRLILVELTRLRWRRAVAVLLAGCALATAVALGGTAWETRPVSPEEMRSAQAELERDREQPWVQREIARCEKNPDLHGAADPAACEELAGPQLDWYLYRQELGVRTAFRTAGLAVITVMLGLLMLVGTTFAGADWNSGSMSNQLLFEPRRARVWLAKAGAVLLLAMATSAVLLVAFAGGLVLLADSRGLEVPPEVPGWVAASAGRAVLLIGAAAVGAYAVTMLFRSTVFTLGAMFAVVAGATVVLATLGVGEQWYPHKNISAILWDGARYYVESPSACFGRGPAPDGVDCSGFGRLELATAARNLGVLLAAAVALSVWSFRRRDVP
ncbi:hypothetical protein ACFP3Q_01055 [Nocardioides sp. GCM10027113]|uniref:hypothetical protein n=1 Tax=unclassified Nocardioides TaxID=2615069 RepID=UPI0036241741